MSRKQLTSRSISCAFFGKVRSIKKAIMYSVMTTGAACSSGLVSS